MSFMDHHRYSTVRRSSESFVAIGRSGVMILGATLDLCSLYNSSLSG